MHRIVSSILLLVIVTLNSCDESCTSGEGPVVQRTLSLEAFNSLTLNGSDKVFIRQGTSQEVVVEGQENIIQLLEKDIRGGHWNIFFSECIRHHRELTFYITVENLDYLEVRGSGIITQEGLLETLRLSAVVTGSGTINTQATADHIETLVTGSGEINMNGNTVTAEHQISGSGEINAFGLASEECIVEITGSGNCYVSVSQLLDVIISGSGSVHYSGNPTVTSQITGSGHVVKE